MNTEICAALRSSVMGGYALFTVLGCGQSFVGAAKNFIINMEE